MKKFLKTLFDEFPELKSDRNSIEKMVYLLNENKPSINVDKKFKKDLRNKVINYSKIKSQKKSNYLVFFAPVFSLFLAVFSFVYFSDDIFIFDNDENNLLEQNIQNDSSPAMMMRTNIFIEDDQGDVWESIQKSKKNNWNSADIISKTRSTVDLSVDDTVGVNLYQNLSSSGVDKSFSFKEYCESINWEYLEDENESSYCSFKDKKCYEDDFDNWNCDNFIK